MVNTRRIELSDNLLLEDGFLLLTEDGSGMLLEGDAVSITPHKSSRIVAAVIDIVKTIRVITSGGSGGAFGSWGSSWLTSWGSSWGSSGGGGTPSPAVDVTVRVPRYPDRDFDRRIELSDNLLLEDGFLLLLEDGNGLLLEGDAITITKRHTQRVTL